MLYRVRDLNELLGRDERARGLFGAAAIDLKEKGALTAQAARSEPPAAPRGKGPVAAPRVPAAIRATPRAAVQRGPP